MRHRVEHRHPEALVERRKREDARALIKGVEFGIGDVAQNIDVAAARALFHCPQLLGCAESIRRASERQTPPGGQSFKGSHESRNVFAALYGPHAKHQILPRFGNPVGSADTMRHHANPVHPDSKQLHDL